MASAHTDPFCRDHLPPREQWPQLLFELPELQYPAQLNAARELLAGPPGDRPCVRGGGERWTYGELRHRAAQVAAVLTDDLGLVPGNRVLLRGPNEPWQVACWLGVLLAGGVAVSTMPMLRTSELSAITELSRPALALVHHGFTDEVPAGLRTVAYGADAELTDRCAAHDGVFTAVDTAADDVALLAFTSGTTGRPKATMHLHRDVLAIADTFSRHVVRMQPSDVVTGTPPIAFTFGLGGLVVFPLRAGASTVLLDRVTPDQLADAVAAHGATVLFTAPTAYRAMIAAGKADRLAGLRRAVSAGETLPASVWHAVHDATGLKIIDGIGSTEMLHVFISAADDDIRPGSTGRAVPGYRAAVLDDDGHPVPDGTPGHLAVRGPTGCRYLDGDRQGSYVRHGWNLTGDTYVRDADGYFTYLARSDDMIVSSGYNISGPEVEQALLGHPDVLDCAVVATPDEERGALVTAYVVLREGAVPDPAALQDHVKQVIAPYKYPRRVEFVAQLPRTSTGKLQRYVLRERAAGGR
ncbi:AMP-binding protein [Pseudonocardia kunmingensis]|uniref:2-aminobenzoate-CoA ligase n=1 Tax=Pseudonocardia kunmingensis TaxID=630975 RepID=A0A543D4J8_9PSEU|nr:AMP-binding protein [Pseudonocardia kunmingensis]TQM04255.1 2-aminobenzoate-CoA ligase [Pseudonocardia kunmingensis]